MSRLAPLEVLRRARILFVVNEPYFFYTHRLHLAMELLRKGAEVHLAAPDDAVWAPRGFSLVDITKEGVICHKVPISRRGQNPFREVATIVNLVRLFSRLKPDAVHLLTIKPVLYGGLAARFLKLPAVVVAFTGLGHIFSSPGLVSSVRRWAVASLLRFSLRRPGIAIILQNAGDREKVGTLLRQGEEELHLIRGSGVDTSHFTPMPEHDGPTCIVLPARLIWEKGVADFVAAASILRQRFAPEDVRFVLVGDTHPSNPRAVPEAQIRQWANQNLVEWWGRREDMLDVYSRAHVVCLPSYYGEGLPKVLIEAAACGRPCVACDTPGCRDAIVDKSTGLLVEPRDPGALADALQRLIQSPSLRRAMGSAGRLRAVEVFDIDHIVGQTLGVYRNLLGRARRNEP